MPELIEQMYCSQQIVIPPKFPYILKRYCKAAIKTQPYDLLRWSFEYFSALSENRPPPVKLRLEYPIYSTEGGLTRGCLKVLANQLAGMTNLPLPVVRKAWRGFCLDPAELKRIFCLCEVYMRQESVPFLRFIAVAGGLLTKTLTHTMILLCETLTKEPEGGSAAIPITDFLTMYEYLARLDASKDVKYFNGYREGETPRQESIVEEEEQQQEVEIEEEKLSDDYWQDTRHLQKLNLIGDYVSHTSRLSAKLTLPVIGKLERSPSIERATQIERESYLRERKGRAARNEDVEQKLRELSSTLVGTQEITSDDFPKKEEKVQKKKEDVKIVTFDEDGNEIPYELYGEPVDTPQIEEEEMDEEIMLGTGEETENAEDELQIDIEKRKIQYFVDECYKDRERRRADLIQTFDEIAEIVDTYKSANYDLGMVAGRQMSTTSGEFIVANIQKEIMDYINEQIAILPDPDLKKKKAKPEEVQMIKDLLEKFLDDNMDVIAPEIEEVEEEEQAIPDVTVVYAVPGIGAPVDEDLMKDFEEYALEVCKVQADVFMPRNIRHFLCPPLEMYESHFQKEEVATGGVITD
ncbi:uncharacterized protein LOC123871417 [Maniola jurtina]|uniref:uncharacterized protein LOC123871417 n=1 Tax=Maniola jurtina TaxID=191418 RepID=UPI001E68D63E|nr:uncharacterized protein LOC123871417 [Maniola jurtina]